MCKGVTTVEEKNGDVLPAADFVLKHVPIRIWQDLGVYPSGSERANDGVVVESVYLWDRPRPYTLSIKPNEDATVNVEVFPQGQENVVYGRYLQDPDDLKDILPAMQAAQTIPRF